MFKELENNTLMFKNERTRQSKKTLSKIEK